MSFDWKKTLASVAPALATALGGPLAGMAAGVAVKALGGEDQGETDNLKQVAAAVASGDPNVFVKLQQAEQEYLLEMEKLDLEHERVHQLDRASARDLAKTTGTGPQVTISALYSAGYFGLVGAMALGYVEVLPSYEDLLREVVILLGGAQLLIINFWFGSSAGSKAKTDALANVGK